MKGYFLFTLLFAISASYCEMMTIEFLFHTCAEVESEPRLVNRSSRMEVTFDSKEGKGKLKSYSPFSDSFETIDVKVWSVNGGLHFVENNENGLGVITFTPLDQNNATYSSSTIMHGVLLSYQLYGSGRLLKER